MKEFIRALQIVVGGFLLIVILVTISSIFSFPKQFQLFVVESGSMEPSIDEGSIVAVSPQQEYQIGDVITFHSRINDQQTQEFIVTHRINSIENQNGSTLYETKGDANDNPDPLFVPDTKVIGKVVYDLPLFGYLIGFAKSQIGFVLLVIAPAIYIIMREVEVIKKEWQKRKLAKAD